MTWQALAPGLHLPGQQRWLVHHRQRFLSTGQGLFWRPEQLALIPESLQLGREVLGRYQDAALHLLELSEEWTGAEDGGLHWISLRQLMGEQDALGFKVFGYASQIGNWLSQNRFCGRCGTPMQGVPGERARQCPACALRHYPRLSPSIIVLVTRGEHLLLARSPHFLPGRYSTLAGFIEPGESAEACLHREVMEEVGVEVDGLEYLGSQNWPFPHSLMLAYHARYRRGEIVPQPGEIEDARWFHYRELPDLPPPQAISRYLIDLYLARLSGLPEPVLPG